MTFLSPSILWALFAVSIPLIIHLISLRQTKLEEFSSLRGQLKKDLKRLPGVATKRSKGQQTGALRISDFYDFNTDVLKKFEYLIEIESFGNKL